MPSALMRRSGIAAVHISKLIGFNPKTVVQAGVGLNHQEVDCIWEQWPDVEFFGFEPNPILFKKLRGKYPGYLSNFAVSNNSGTADLHFRRRHKDGSSLNGLDFKADIEAWLPRVRIGGVLAGHDFAPGYGGVKQAVRELFGNKFKKNLDVWFIQITEEMKCQTSICYDGKS